MKTKKNAPAVAAPAQVVEAEDEGRNQVQHHEFILAWEDLRLKDGTSFEDGQFEKMGKVNTLADFCTFVGYANPKSAQVRASQIRNADPDSARYYPLRFLAGESTRKPEEDLLTLRDKMMQFQGHETAKPQTVNAAQVKRGPGRPRKSA